MYVRPIICDDVGERRLAHLAGSLDDDRGEGVQRFLGEAREMSLDQVGHGHNVPYFSHEVEQLRYTRSNIYGVCQHPDVSPDLPGTRGLSGDALPEQPAPDGHAADDHEGQERHRQTRHGQGAMVA